MGYVYRYTDQKDGIIKYVGIVWSSKRDLINRIKEHYRCDKWCFDHNWKIEYINVNNRTDCEALESHFISLYRTDLYFNKRKSGWGTSNVYNLFDWEWKEIKIDFQKSEITRKSSAKSSKSFIEKLYDKSIYIYNNGVEYCFVKSFSKQTTNLYMALDDESVQYAKDNNIQFMDKKSLEYIVSKIDLDKKPYGYEKFPDEKEQMIIEPGLKLEHCYTYKIKEKIRKLLEKNHEDNVISFNKYFYCLLEQMINNCVNEEKIISFVSDSMKIIGNHYAEEKT